MDTKITKARIGTHFEYDWIKYIAIVLASVALWLVIYTSLDAVPHQDAIDIFCLGNVSTPLVSDEIEDELRKDVLHMLGGVQEVNVQANNRYYTKNADNSYSIDTTLSAIVQTSFMTNDLCIVPKSFFDAHMSAVDYESFFLSFDEIIEAGYFGSAEDKAALDYIESVGAFYRYEFTEDDCKSYDEHGNAVEMTPEEIEALKTADGSTWHKRYGILLNNVPGLSKSCLFAFDDKVPETDEEGVPSEPETEQFVLAFIKGYGLNVGTFNREAKLFGCGKDETPYAYRSDAFTLVTKLFTVVDNPNSVHNGRAQIVKYAPILS